jgi:hypothetical protein
VNTLDAKSPKVDAEEIALVANALKTREAAANGVSGPSSRTSRVGRSSGEGSSITVLQLVCGAWSGLRLLFTSTANGRACGFMFALWGIEEGWRRNGGVLPLLSWVVIGVQCANSRLREREPVNQHL